MNSSENIKNDMELEFCTTDNQFTNNPRISTLLNNNFLIFNRCISKHYDYKNTNKCCRSVTLMVNDAFHVNSVTTEIRGTHVL